MTIIEIVQQFKSLDVNSISMKSKHFKVPLECIYITVSPQIVYMCVQKYIALYLGTTFLMNYSEITLFEFVPIKDPLYLVPRIIGY